MRNQNPRNSPSPVHSRQRACAALSVSLCVLLGMASDAHADDTSVRATQVRVRVEAKPDPVKAVGVVFSPGGSQQIPEATITKIGDKLFDIQFSVPNASIGKGSVATALAYDESNKVSYANVTPISPGKATSFAASVPDCPAKGASNAGVLSGVGPLKQLVDFRSQRVDLSRVKLGRAMDKPLLGRLRELEKAFGLERTTPLSAELPPEELVERLSRLQYALAKSVAKYQSNKTK